jgi:hypothetical protein
VLNVLPGGKNRQPKHFGICGFVFIVISHSQQLALNLLLISSGNAWLAVHKLTAISQHSKSAVEIE